MTAQYDRWSWKGYFNEYSNYENLECPAYTGITISDNVKCRNAQRIVPNSPYHLYLIHKSSGINNFNAYNSNVQIGYFYPTWDMIIDKGTGTIPEDGYLEFEIELPTTNNYNDIKPDLTDSKYNIEDWWITSGRNRSKYF